MFIFALHVSAGYAQSKANINGLTPGASLLFKNVKSKLTVGDKNEIYKSLGLKLAKDKKSFVDEDNNSPEDAMVYPTDLNSDGKEEEFVILSSELLFGTESGGSNIVFFTKNLIGKYGICAIPAPGLSLLPTKSFGYPDVLPEIVSSDQQKGVPVWKWDGKKYNFYKVVNNSQLPPAPKKLADVSKDYQNTIKN
jgi:hypothetical protein